MATTTFPTRDDFAALLNESLGGENETFEGKVVKGTVTGIENDMAVIDVGLKSEGRVPLREFAAPGQKADLNIGDTVEVYVDRVENSAWRGDAVARPRPPRSRVGQARGRILRRQPRRGRDLRPRQGRLHRRSRRRRRLPSRLPGRHPPGARRRAADGHSAALPDFEDGPPPRQYRRVAPSDPRGNPRRAAQRPHPVARRGPGDRGRGQEHHRLRRVRRPRWDRRPAPRHRHFATSASTTRPRCSASAIR